MAKIRICGKCKVKPADMWDCDVCHDCWMILRRMYR